MTRYECEEDPGIHICLSLSKRIPEAVLQEITRFARLVFSRAPDIPVT
jgi:hypothetical protein